MYIHSRNMKTKKYYRKIETNNDRDVSLSWRAELNFVYFTLSK